MKYSAMHSGGYDRLVTFSFITPQRHLVCEHPADYIAECMGSDAGSPSCVSCSGDQPHFQKVVVVKYLEGKWNVARTQAYSCDEGATMQSLYEALHAWLQEVGSLVCYHLVSLPTDGVLEPVISRILFAKDAIEDVVYCQRLAQPVPLSPVLTRWVAVNVLTVLPQGDIAVGHVPFVIGLHGQVSQETIVDHLQLLCGASAAEVAHARSSMMLRCALWKGVVRLEEMSDGYEGTLEQVALIYPKLVVGDVVRVDTGCGASGIQSMQGIVHSLRTEDGMLSYDVIGYETGTLLEGLSCMQVIPL